MANYKKILTVEDLLIFCQTQNFNYFNSSDTGYKLAVKVPTTFEEVTNVDDNHRGMLKLKFKIFHTGLNRNGSFVSESSAKEAMKTIADRPVLGYIHQLDDGEWDFAAHEMEIIQNDDGQDELRYLESQVGSFSSEPAFWEHDEETGNDFVCAYAYISEEYTKAAEIIKRKGGTKNSCELCIDELSYNAKEEYLELNKFFVSGSTLLGSLPDGTEIQEGMKGSRADIADFSVENNSTVNSDKFEDTTGKEERSMQKDEIMEVAEEAVEAFEDATEDTADEEATEVEDETETGDAPNVGDEGISPLSDLDGDGDGDEEESDNDDEEYKNITNHSLTCSVQVGDAKKEFSVSLSDIIYALTELVNDTYADDYTYYQVDVFEDDDYVIMCDCWSGKAYKQTFKKKKDCYTLTGDRVPVKAVYLTADEEKALDDMRAKYSTFEDVSAKLAKYEEEPEKMSILNSEDYIQIAESEEFMAFKEQESHFDMSIDEVKAKADEMLLEFAKKGSLTFATEDTSVKMRKIPTSTRKTSRYGNLFKK